MRLIDADALMRRLCVQCDVESHEATCDPDECFVYNVIVYDAPTIDAEPVRHGTWKTSFVYDWDGNKLYIHFHRECGFEYRNYLEDEQPYCPHCGAKMDGGGEA